MSTITLKHEYPRRLKAAFIGCGGHAQRNVYPALQYAPVDLTAVCDLDAGRAAQCARQFGAERVYTSHAEMLERERPEVVFIVTNYDEHGLPRYPKLAVECMRAGAHAWIEKPPAASVAEVRDMMAVSAETGRQVGVGFKKMFFPANVKAAEIIARPEFGRVSSINARYPQPLPPLDQRGDPRAMMGFLDHMVHPHATLKLLGGELDWIFVNRTGVNGACEVSLRFKSGAIGNLHMAWGASGYSPLERTEIVGEGANVVVENNLRVTYYRQGSPGAYGRTPSYFSGGDGDDDQSAPLHWEPEFSLGQLYNKGLFLLGYAPQVIHFTERLLAGQAPERGSLGDALELMKIYEAYLRAPDGEVVRI